jgi:tetratricopeptide (TPR) repeat protein
MMSRSHGIFPLAKAGEFGGLMIGDIDSIMKKHQRKILGPWGWLPARIELRFHTASRNGGDRVRFLHRWLDLPRNSRRMMKISKAPNELQAQAEKCASLKAILIFEQARLKLFLFFALAASLFAGCSSRTAAPEARYVPAGDLLDIVKDFQRLAKEDTYRFPIPKDITGVNIMKATLVRLNDYESKNRGQFSDIVQFNKALALERLREYDQAAALYRKVGETDGRLGTEAAKNAGILDDFLRIFDRPVPSDDPFKYIAGLDQKVAAWNQLIQKHKGTPYEYLARVEEERIDRAKVAFVEANRYRLKDGNQLTIVGYSQLVTKHEQSKNIHRYLIDFGDFYMVLAKEYASQYDPEGLIYDSKILDQFVKSALKLYAEVVQVDGIVEKTEAQGKIEAARGFLEKMTRLNR